MLFNWLKRKITNTKEPSQIQTLAPDNNDFELYRERIMELIAKYSRIPLRYDGEWDEKLLFFEGNMDGGTFHVEIKRSDNEEEIIRQINQLYADYQYLKENLVLEHSEDKEPIQFFRYYYSYGYRVFEFKCGKDEIKIDFHASLSTPKEGLYRYLANVRNEVEGVLKKVDGIYRLGEMDILHFLKNHVGQNLTIVAKSKS